MILFEKLVRIKQRRLNKLALQGLWSYAILNFKDSQKGKLSLEIKYRFRVGKF